MKNEKEKENGVERQGNHPMGHADGFVRTTKNCLTEGNRVECNNCVECNKHDLQKAKLRPKTVLS